MKTFTLGELLAPVDVRHHQKIMANWQWLSGDEVEPLVVTAFGDLFVVDSDGKVRLVNACRGDITVFTESVAEFKETIRVTSNLHKVIKVSLLEQLHDRRILLRPGMCYAPVRLPMLGGPITVDNMEVAPWANYFDWMGIVLKKFRSERQAG